MLFKGNTHYLNLYVHMNPWDFEPQRQLKTWVTSF